jgi:hypothetical protein
LVTAEQPAQAVHPHGWAHLATKPAPDVPVIHPRRFETYLRGNTSKALTDDPHRPTHRVHPSLTGLQFARESLQQLLLELIDGATLIPAQQADAMGRIGDISPTPPADLTTLPRHVSPPLDVSGEY